MRRTRFHRLAPMLLFAASATALTWSAALLGAFVCGSPAYCQQVESEPVLDASSTDLKTDVLEWVDELDAPNLAKRQAAEKSLIEAGPKVLEFLPESKPDASIEAGERLARVRKTLTEAKTEEHSLAIVIRLKEANTLGEALEAISRDSGIEFEYDGDESIPIKSTSAPLSFWHSIDSVLDQANLDINFYGGDRGTLQLVPRHPDRPSRVDSAAYTGVYRIEPQSVTSRRELKQADLSGLNISIEISWEPRLTPIGLTIPITQLTGRLDDGAILKPQASGETIDVATHSDIAFSEFFFPMQLPAGRPKQITVLSGVIRSLLPGKKQTFELPIDQVGSDVKIDAMTVRIEDVRKNGELTELRLAIELDDPGRSLESHRQWILENETYVKAKDDSRIEHLGYEVYRQTSSSVGIGYLFDLGDDPSNHTLIYQSPTAVINNEVPFVIQDIPLP